MVEFLGSLIYSVICSIQYSALFLSNFYSLGLLLYHYCSSIVLSYNINDDSIIITVTTLFKYCIKWVQKEWATFSCSWIQWNCFDYSPFNLILTIGSRLPLLSGGRSPVSPILPSLQCEMILDFAMGLFASNKIQKSMQYISFSLRIWWGKLTNFHIMKHSCLSGKKTT